MNSPLRDLMDAGDRRVEPSRGATPPASAKDGTGPTPVEQLAAQAVRDQPWVRVLEEVGSFYAFCLEVFKKMFTRKFRFDEFVHQAWFISSVSIGPAIMVSIPFCVVLTFQINQILIQIGAVDLAGAGSAVAVIRELGPIVSVLAVAGAGATAIAADLGARTIREEIDAIVTLGIDPIQRLVVPRVLAATLIGVALNALVSIVGLAGGYFFSVHLQGATPGLFVSDLSLLVGVFDFVIAEIKAAVFGLLAGLTACYLGLRVKGGPKGVGDAVNQTVVFSFMLLFAANSVITAIFFQFKGH